MKFSIMFRILPNYGNFILHVLFFEIIYFFLGFKQSSINILNNEKQSDNIPCPYFFLYKIKKFFLNEKINSLIDLGCGGGRALYFFKKYKKINYYGIENNNNIYNGCKKLFEKDKNITIYNEDIMSLKFLNYNNDCFFINDPLKKKEDFDKLISNIFKKNENDRKIYFILVNLDENKRQIFNSCKLIEFFQIKTKGYYIYSNEKK